MTLRIPSEVRQAERGTRAWSLRETLDLFELPFSDLLFEAQSVHRQHHDPNRIQVATLLSIKTGGCP